MVINQLIMFTINTKISATWSIIGDYLVKGDFIYRKDSNNFPAIKYQINAEISPITINCKCYLVKFENLENKPQNITQQLINHKCVVLPSLKPTQIICKHSNLPINPIFQTRYDVCNYWNQMYGYELSTTSHDYVSVSFVANTTLLYPLECVLEKKPEFVTLNAQNLPYNESISTPKPNLLHSTYGTQSFISQDILEIFVKNLNKVFIENLFYYGNEKNKNTFDDAISDDIIDCQVTSSNSQEDRFSACYYGDYTPPKYLQCINNPQKNNNLIKKINENRMMEHHNNFNKYVRNKTLSTVNHHHDTTLLLRKAVCSKTIRSNKRHSNQLVIDKPSPSQTMLNSMNVDVVMGKLWKRARNSSHKRKQNAFKKYQRSPN